MCGMPFQHFLLKLLQDNFNILIDKVTLALGDQWPTAFYFNNIVINKDFFNVVFIQPSFWVFFNSRKCLLLHCLYEAMYKMFMLNLLQNAMSFSIEPLKEPRGFIKIIQWVSKYKYKLQDLNTFVHVKPKLLDIQCTFFVYGGTKCIMSWKIFWFYNAFQMES